MATVIQKNTFYPLKCLCKILAPITVQFLKTPMTLFKCGYKMWSNLKLFDQVLTDESQLELQWSYLFWRLGQLISPLCLEFISLYDNSFMFIQSAVICCYTFLNFQSPVLNTHQPCTYRSLPTTNLNVLQDFFQLSVLKFSMEHVFK